MRQLHELGDCWCGAHHIPGEPYQGIPVVWTGPDPVLADSASIADDLPEEDRS